MCGNVLRGVRAESFQALPCPACGRRRFILPYTRLPPPTDVGKPAIAAPARSGQSWLLAASVAAVLLALGGTVAFLWNRSNNDGRTGPPPEGKEALPQHIKAGRGALDQGKIRLAAEEFKAAEAIHARFPSALPTAERRQLRQLRRQADIISDLVPISMDELLQQAVERSEVDPREWKEEFAARFQGKSVIFDDEVRHEGAGVYRLTTSPFSVRGRPAQVALGDLHIMRTLPLDRPQRMLIGARLDSVRLESGGTWVVHLVPDSGVLLTDLAAVRACYPLPPEELREVLERQAAWLAERP
jgi:hypothetical protein